MYVSHHHTLWFDRFTLVFSVHSVSCMFLQMDQRKKRHQKLLQEVCHTPSFMQQATLAGLRLRIQNQSISCCFCAVIDASSQTLFLTEMFRGLNLTLKAFFDRKVTVRPLLPTYRLQTLLFGFSETYVHRVLIATNCYFADQLSL